MENNIDLTSFFTNLQKEEEKGSSFKDNSNKIEKIYSKFPAHQGSVYFLPFSSKSGLPMTAVENVLTAKLKIEDKDFSIKILPKEFLSIVPGSPEDQLYGELVSLHRNLYDKKGTNYSLAKFEKFYLMYAWVLQHYDINGTLVQQKVPALLVMANKKFREAFGQATKQTTIVRGNLDWTRDYYSRESQRTRLVKLTFKLSGNEYMFTYNHEKIDSDYYGMTDNKDVVTVDPAVIDTYFGDPVNDFMGCDKIEERFRYDFYLKVKDAMQAELNKLNDLVVPNAAPVQQQAPTKQEVVQANINAQFPPQQPQPITAQQVAQQPEQPNPFGEAPKMETENNDGLPF